MRLQRRPDLMTLLWWIAVTGVSLSMWPHAQANDRSNDIPEPKLAAMGYAYTPRVILNVPRSAPEYGALSQRRRDWFFSVGAQSSVRNIGLNWNMARRAAPLLTQLEAGDAYILIGFRGTWQ